MKKLLFISLMFMYGLSDASSKTNILYQYGLLDDALHGQYNKIATVAEISKYSDFALGAGVGLGEFIAVDGKFYVTDAYGHLISLDKKDNISFATAAKFHPDYDLGFDISNISSLKQLEEQIEEELPNKNMMYAIKVTGYFDKLHARSEDIDTEPYTPIVSWMQTHQHEFDCNDQKSTLVIFRMPDSLFNLGVKYHAHFVNGDRTMGGHVFDVATAENLDIEITPLTEAIVYLRKKNVPTIAANGDLGADKFYTVIERSFNNVSSNNNGVNVTNSAGK